MNTSPSTDLHFLLSGILRPIIAAELDRKFKELQLALPNSDPNERPFNLSEAANFLGIAEQTIYQNIRKIPHSKRFGKLYFLRSELENYLKTGKGSPKENKHS